MRHSVFAFLSFCVTNLTIGFAVPLGANITASPELVTVERMEAVQLLISTTDGTSASNTHTVSPHV